MPLHANDPKLVYNSIHDDLTLDGSTTLNLASFVNVHVEDEAEKLIMENLTKNLADNDEYPILIDFQQRCISMLANLWHAPMKLQDTGILTPQSGETYSTIQQSALGTACTGSSEAIMLGGLAMKKNWQARRKRAGKDISSPNILMASCCQVALEKFAKYFDVEARVIPCDPSDFLIDYDKISESLDENTIGIFVIVGSTYTGGFEDVGKVSAILDEYEAKTGNWVPIHVDGASGGLIAPIIYPDLKWDFRIDRVVSINTSGHKFGLTTAGLGWVVFRSQDWLPDELKFELDYLGGVEESFNLNFSRPGFQVVHQYYNFLRLGYEGYYEIFNNCLINARVLSDFLVDTGYFKCVSNLHLPVGVTSRGKNSTACATKKPSVIPQRIQFASQHDKFNPALPVVSFQFSPEFQEKYPEIPQSLVSKLLRNKKWIIPNYHLPFTTPGKNPEDVKANSEILRIVVKNNLTSALLDKLMHDIVDVVSVLIKSSELLKSDIGDAKLDSNASEKLIYNMLLSISNDGEEKLMKSLKKLTLGAEEDRKDVDGTVRDSFRGIC
ncbi:unnamed protein product [Ambrosiozyma monospora]|uniref:Glutamate decarboxylase n=1 Tax=Ambrosiozyma monospora TaxID=43982 RepID=A0A9W6YY24_AMBMO|nr:unnamed protein product [Ambrosiozyma monospora]